MTFEAFDRLPSILVVRISKPVGEIFQFSTFRASVIDDSLHEVFEFIRLGIHDRWWWKFLTVGESNGTWDVWFEVGGVDNRMHLEVCRQIDSVRVWS